MRTIECPPSTTFKKILTSDYCIPDTSQLYCGVVHFPQFFTLSTPKIINNALFGLEKLNTALK